MKVIHPFEPVYSTESKILILGSFPSVKSREDNFYYAHPQNRFWRIIASILNEDVPRNINQKKDILLNGKIAVWDVLKSCKIEGSSDASIKEPIVNDISKVLDITNISCIFFYGNEAFNIYNKYLKSKLHIKCKVLPSTSPANAMWNFDRLLEVWKKEIIEELG